MVLMLWDILSIFSIQKILSSIHGGTADKYWQNASINLLITIYKIQMNSQRIYENFKLLEKYNIRIFHLKEQETSLSSLYGVVSSVNNLLQFIQDTDSYINTIKRTIKMVLETSKDKAIPIIKQIAFHLEKIIEVSKELESFRKLDSSRNDIGGLYGVVDCASAPLTSAATNEYINTDSFDITKSLRQGSIIIVNLANLDNNILGLFNLSIYKALQNNLNNDNSCDVSIFIDEAQKVLHPDYLPDVDVCRESRFEYIFATQDELLLNSTIGAENTQMLLRNIVEQYSFATNDLDSETSQLQKFEYRNLITNKNSFAKTIFFSKEELFEVEYEYQANKNIKCLIDPVQLEDLRIEDEFILINSPLLYDRNEINIKTKNNGIYTLKLQNFENNILEKHYPKEEDSEELTSLSELGNILNKKNSSSENDGISLEERVKNLEIVYKKIEEDLKSLERKHELIENKNKDYFNKILKF